MFLHNKIKSPYAIAAQGPIKSNGSCLYAKLQSLNEATGRVVFPQVQVLDGVNIRSIQGLDCPDRVTVGLLDFFAALLRFTVRRNDVYVQSVDLQVGHVVLTPGEVIRDVRGFDLFAARLFLLSAGLMADRCQSEYGEQQGCQKCVFHAC